MRWQEAHHNTGVGAICWLPDIKGWAPACDRKSAWVRPVAVSFESPVEAIGRSALPVADQFPVQSVDLLIRPGVHK